MPLKKKATRKKVARKKKTATTTSGVTVSMLAAALRATFTADNPLPVKIVREVSVRDPEENWCTEPTRNGRCSSDAVRDGLCVSHWRRKQRGDSA